LFSKKSTEQAYEYRGETGNLVVCIDQTAQCSVSDETASQWPDIVSQINHFHQYPVDILLSTTFSITLLIGNIDVILIITFALQLNINNLTTSIEQYSNN